MGPYNEDRQLQRAKSIIGLLLKDDMDKDVRKTWVSHLRRIARNEEDYNERVVQVYGDTTWIQ